jgi:hypothetical protein
LLKIKKLKNSVEGTLRGMFTPHPRIAEPLDVIEDVRSGFGMRVVAPSIDPFALQHSEEVFEAASL